MQSVNTCLEQRAVIHKWQPASIEAQSSSIASVKRYKKEFKSHSISMFLNNSRRIQV